MNKYVTLKFVNPEDHKDFEIGWLFHVVQVDRSKGEVIFEEPSIERMETVCKRSREFHTGPKPVEKEIKE